MSASGPGLRKVDVAILGGGLCGVGAAFALAAEGKRVLLIERRASFAWETTVALQCELAASDSPLVKRFRSELDARGGLRDNRIGPPVFELVLNRLLADEGIEILLYSYPLKLITKGDLVSGVIIGNKTGQQVVTADIFVDATDEAVLWRQTDVAFEDVPDSVMRQTVFFNHITGDMELPLSIGDSVGARNLVIHSSVRDREVCLEFDLPGCSISTARLALAEAIFFARVNVKKELTWAIVTHSGSEPFPLDVAAHLDEKKLEHPCLANLFASGTWTIPDKSERQQANTLAGRIALGEEVGCLAGRAPIEVSDSGTVDMPLIPETYREADVVVCGGGTAGPVAAIAAGRHGAKVILLEASPLLGGMGTGGVVHSYYPMVPAGLLGAGGITAERKLECPEDVFEYYYRAFGGLQDELDVRVEKIANFLFAGKHKCFGFHPEAKKLVLEQMCHEAGVEIMYGTTAIGAEMDEEKRDVIRGVVVATPDGPILCRGKVVIDSTGDVDVAAMAGVPFTMGREGDGAQHTFSSPRGGSLAADGSLGIGGGGAGDLGYVDASDAADMTRARRLGFDWLYEHSNFNALYFAPLVGLRQCRQIIGEYQLTLADQIAGRRFDDCIAYMQAHFDDHADDYENESDEAVLWTWLLGKWQEVIGCEVPYRCLVPRYVEGLLVACRGVSMTVDAHYAFRMMPEMQQMGEAAGIAAALSAKLGVTPRALDIRLVQDELRKTGVLADKNSPRALIRERRLPELREMLLSDEPQDAVWLLTQCDRDEALPLLTDMLRAGPAQARFWAAVALAMHRSAEAVPELVACVQERRAEIPDGLKTVPVWQSAIVLLGRIGDPAAVPTLLKVLSDDSADFDTLIAAARALGRIDDDSAVPALTRLLEREDLAEKKKLRRPAREDVLWQLHLAVAEALARCGAECPEVLERYSHDPRSSVRRYSGKIADLLERNRKQTPCNPKC